jgi:hypothetical protein
MSGEDVEEIFIRVVEYYLVVLPELDWRWEGQMWVVFVC